MRQLTTCIALLIIISPCLAADGNSVMGTLPSRPMAFTRNMGQWDERVLFKTDMQGMTVWFTTEGVYYQFTRSVSSPKDDNHVIPITSREYNHDESNNIESIMIKTSFVGADKKLQMIGEDVMQYKCNYFKGDNLSESYVNVPNYHVVAYKNIYPGVDLKYYGKDGEIKYDYIVDPDANLDQIRIKYEGVEPLHINNSGELVVTTDWGTVVERKPKTYQIINGQQVAIESEYVLINENVFGFSLPGKFNPEYEIVVDPTISYSSYLGGNGSESYIDIALDNDRNVILSGRTSSTDFPITPFPDMPEPEGTYAYITKLNSIGDALLFSTYVYMNRDAMALDPDGNIYLIGSTGGGTPDAYIVKLSPNGNRLIYFATIGGDDFRGTVGKAITVDDFGNAYIAGQTWSDEFPTVNGFQSGAGGLGDGFVAILNPDGSEWLYSSYIGGTNGEDWCKAIDVDGSGNIYLVGGTDATDFPITFDAIESTPRTGFFIKLRPSGNPATQLIYGTYMGASMGYADVQVDNLDRATIVGWGGDALPFINAYQEIPSAGTFIARFNSACVPEFITSFGGQVENGEFFQAQDLALDSDGNIYFGGRVQLTGLGRYDVKVAALNAAGNAEIFNISFGGNDPSIGNIDYVDDIAVDAAGRIYVAGRTNSIDFPIVSGFQPMFGGGNLDNFVAMLSESVICEDPDVDGYYTGVLGNPCANVDNCPNDWNPTQADADLDGMGDACDPCVNDPDNDIDEDTFCGDIDNCPNDWNDDQADIDGDGVGDLCDNCIDFPNPGQEDSNDNGIGNACECYIKVDMNADLIIDVQIIDPGCGTNIQNDPNAALCQLDNQYVSLGGDGGYIILDMGQGEEILNGDGTDFTVRLDYQYDGQRPAYRTLVGNAPGGPFFDLGSRISTASFDLSNIGLSIARYVKIVDATPLCGPDATNGTPGVDIDAIVARNTVNNSPGASYAGYSPIDFEITSPGGLLITKAFSEDENAIYHATDLDGDGLLEDLVDFYSPETGIYNIDIVLDPSDTSGETLYSITAYQDSDSTVLAVNVSIENLPDTYQYEYIPSFVCGDANGDGGINLGDSGFIINWIFYDGPTPDPLESGDSNGDGSTNLGDASYVINYIFYDGPEPVCP